MLVLQPHPRAFNLKMELARLAGAMRAAGDQPRRRILGAALDERLDADLRTRVRQARVTGGLLCTNGPSGLSPSCAPVHQAGHGFGSGTTSRISLPPMSARS
jgi:hypothetical protein